MILRKTEFACRAQHAGRLDPTHFCDANSHPAGQTRTDHRKRHLDASGRIWCAADDLQQGALPCINPAHAQLIGVGVRLDRIDARDNDAGKLGGDRIGFLDLKPCHRQAMRELVGADGGIDQCAQPGLGKLHDEPCWVLRN